MKSTGIVRKIDELGRIVLPMELRRVMDIKEKDAIEIFVDGSTIILKNMNQPVYSAITQMTLCRIKEKTYAKTVWMS